MRFLCTTNYRIEYIIKRFSEDCSIRTICSYVVCCLVPKPHYSARPKRLGSRGPNVNVRSRQKSSKVRQLKALVYKTNILHFQVKNTPLKDANGKEKFKRMLSFLLDKGRLFFTKLSFEEFEVHEISIIGAFNATKQRSFGRIFRYILYSVVQEITFLKGELFIAPQGFRPEAKSRGGTLVTRAYIEYSTYSSNIQSVY